MASPEGSYDGGVGVSDGAVDTSSPSPATDSQQLQQPVAGQQQATQPPAINPAWNDVLNYIPREFVPKITPALQKWDHNYSELESKYKQWEGLGQPFDVVQNGLNVINELNSNPQAFYQRLGALLGVGPQEAQQAVEQSQDNQYETDDDGEELDAQGYPVDPEVAALRQTVEQLVQQQNQYQEERQNTAHQQEVDRIEQEVDGNIRRLAAQHQQQYPGVPFNPGEIISRVLLQSYQNPDVEPSLERAYADYMSFAQSFSGASIHPPSPHAPSVLNPSMGGMPPSEQVNPATATPEQRKAMVGQYLAQLRSQQ